MTAPTHPTANHLDTGAPRYAAAARAILARHDNYEAEANITTAVRDFLVLTGLAQSDAIVEENPPSDGSRQAVDLTALDTFIEFKRRIGTAAAGAPDPSNVAQLDDYLEQSRAAGKGIRMGILTDGKRWLLRWPGAGTPRLTRPWFFTLEAPDRWPLLYEWLRDNALFALESVPVNRQTVEQHLGPASAASQRDLRTLAQLYARAAARETVRVKRRLWHNLLTAALGEIARQPAELDDLFIRHTYLSLVVGIAVPAAFGVDIRQIAETDPADLLNGRAFQEATGLSGVISSDFFAWPGEVDGGAALLQTLARRLARFDWTGEHSAGPPPDIAAILYETVIPPEERRTLGEYYTPDWLAQAMVREIVTDPLRQRVLDPACGSGTFIAAAVAHYLAAARDAGRPPGATLDGLRAAVAGIDVHPAAVHLARAAWALAARPAVTAARAANPDADVSGSVPVYLGDALQLRFRNGDLFAQQQVTVPAEDNDGNIIAELVFPISLVKRADTFDSLLTQAAADIEAGDDPLLALDDYNIADPAERQTLSETFAALQALHRAGRNHIWAYYTRNLVRPVALGRTGVDALIGNPPWLSYNRTAAVLRTELEAQSKTHYGIWAGGRYASNQDVAELFYARCVDLYLKDGGVIGMVLPHSALQSGQYAKWRSGEWQASPTGRGRNRVPGRTLAVNFAHRPAWDLEPLEPNTFFPMASCVVFAERIGENAPGAPLAGAVEQWQGPTGTDEVRRVTRTITDTSDRGEAPSPYDNYARQGASIRPRCLFLVQETVNTAIIQAAPTVTVNPRRGVHDKEPWRSLDLSAMVGQTIENRHLYNVRLGESVAPYTLLEPLQALLPVRRGEHQMPTDTDGPGGIRLGGLYRRMRRRWQLINRLWEDNKPAASNLNLLANLDHYGKLSSQLAWQQDNGGRPIRLVYTAGGEPTAAILEDDAELVDETLYWVTCRDLDEANYLLAIINSQALATAVNRYTTPNWSGKTRSLHKHLWRLPIPQYDPANPSHRTLAEAGARAATGAQQRLGEVRASRATPASATAGRRNQRPLTVTIARRELRAHLRQSPAGQGVEDTVQSLLQGGG